MSIRKGVCDYCGLGRLLESGDESSQIQFGKLWCGTCREGSKARYEERDNEFLSYRISLITEMLEQHPLQWEEPYDHFLMHNFKLMQSDEMWRMKQELEFRSEDVQANS